MPATLFGKVSLAPPDQVVGMVADWRRDTAPQKPNLAQGAYRDECGRPVVFAAVREAERGVVQRGLDKEYLPIDGDAGFRAAAAEICFGAGNPLLRSGRVVTCQVPGGTAALRLCAELVRSVGGTLAVPAPTWPNHGPVFKASGVRIVEYRYCCSSSLAEFDAAGTLRSLEQLPAGTAVLLHASAHNPTGVDPSPKEWAAMAELLKRRGLVAVFDSAYQGFASGDLDRDAAAVRQFAAAGVAVLVAQSMSKNMGLYGERVGAVHAVADNAAEAASLLSQLKRLSRACWSNPPAHGARVAAAVWADAELRKDWLRQLREVDATLRRRRGLLRAELERLQAPSPTGSGWVHLTQQMGMFGFTGMGATHAAQLRARHHVYMLPSGRVSVAGLQESEIPYVAAAFADVLKKRASL
eukprot:TRINITY_DN1037_c0_g1_i6.p1 TRINITY_DN1037_c0_g1~~TRINITY_DN1037_c0_g1_i6.p1  ORF type:complete len:430 (+),score=160.20 TRINITY_DN1037_c0_g1_i6:60-1292(+)